MVPFLCDNFYCPEDLSESHGGIEMSHGKRHISE